MANVFISYAQQDERIAARLSRMLEADGQTVINDPGSLVAGNNFSKEIVEELTNAQVVVVLLSRHSIRGTWVEEELRAGLEKGHQVIPVLLDQDAKNNWVWPLISDRNAIRAETPAELDKVAQVVKHSVEQQQPHIEEEIEGLRGGVLQERAIAYPYAVVQETLVRPIHSYFADMLALLTGPKRFIREHVDDSNLILSLKGAIVFFVTTLGILQISKTQPTDLPRDLLGWLFYVIEYGIITFLAWRCVGGKANFINYIPAQFFLISGLFVLNTLPIEITQRLAGVVDSYRYQELIGAKNSGALLTFLLVNLDKLWLSSRPFVVVIVLGAIVHVALGVFWVTLSWGTYRELNALQWRRSALAYVAFWFLWIPVHAVSLCVRHAFDLILRLLALAS